MRGEGNRKGQVTLFIILAILIVGIGALIYLLTPGIKSRLISFEDNPRGYIQDCLEDTVKENIEIISQNGGLMENEHYTTYEGKKVEYLCYTPDNLEFCIVERPMLISWIESELEDSLEEKIESCFSSMEENYEKRGYTVSIERNGYAIDFTEEKINLEIDYPTTFRKKTTETIDSFSVVVNNNIYELLRIAYNILTWESTYGDASVDFYMDYIPGLLIDKFKKDDGTKIYIIRDLNTGQSFRFASRSLVWSAGLKNN
jgi:hypothetical protein